MCLEDRIAKVCIDEFSKLQLTLRSKLASDTGYIILAGIVLSKSISTSEDEDLKCISLGTGTKCLSKNKLSCIGDSLNDCHAEVIAKRGFQKYLWNQCSLALKDESDLFKFVPKNLSDSGSFEPPFEFKDPGIKFYLYISQAPCGDASTEALDKISAVCSAQPESHKSKRFKVSDDDKIISSVLKGRENFGLKGALRTKPGRVDSEPTLSLSCSDKIARWNTLGIQGGILGTYFVPPIYLDCIVVGELYDKDAFFRAVISRLNEISDLKAPYCTRQPDIMSTQISFVFGKYFNAMNGKDGTIKQSRPQELTLAWSLNCAPEIIVSGRKQGAAKNPKTGIFSIKTRSSICRASLLESYKTLILTPEKSGLLSNRLRFPIDVTYSELKRPTGQLKESPYQVSRSIFLDTPPFKDWLVTQSILEEYNKFN